MAAGFPADRRGRRMRTTTTTDLSQIKKCRRLVSPTHAALDNQRRRSLPLLFDRRGRERSQDTRGFVHVPPCPRSCSPAIRRHFARRPHKIQPNRANKETPTNTLGSMKGRGGGRVGSPAWVVILLENLSTQRHREHSRHVRRFRP